jgi:peroxiredoxin
MSDAVVEVGSQVPEALEKRLPGRGRKRVLYFMRSADCPVCVGHLRKLAAQLPRLESQGATVVVFVPDASASVEAAPGVPFPFAVVSGTDAYGQLGLRRALLGLMQQSGSAVIDGAGRLIYLRRATMPFAALDEPTLFAALEPGAAPMGAT